MRIIAGTHRGRKLKPVNVPGIRPTSDRVREAVFSILFDRVKEAVVADLYAGTGAMGMEALSRGASRCIFVDSNPKALSLMQANLQLLGLEEQSSTIRWNAAQDVLCLQRTGLAFDLVFADPPYAMDAVEATLSNLAEAEVLKPGSTVVFETNHRQEVPEDTPGFTLADQRKYGKTLVSFFSFMI